MAENVASTVRICVTRCPLQSAEENVHSLPCRIHFDGSAAIKSFFQPQTSDCKSNSTDLGGLSSDEQDIDMDKNQESGNTSEKNKLIAEFRGIQLHGENLSLPHLGFTGLVLEDSGMRHPTDEGRVWEVEDYFDQIMWWSGCAKSNDYGSPAAAAGSAAMAHSFFCDNRPSIVILTGECVGEHISKIFVDNARNSVASHLVRYHIYPGQILNIFRDHKSKRSKLGLTQVSKLE